MIAIFTNLSDISSSPNTATYRFVDAYSKKWSRTLKDSVRSTEYDTVSDRYPRFLCDELEAHLSGVRLSAFLQAAQRIRRQLSARITASGNF